MRRVLLFLLLLGLPRALNARGTVRDPALVARPGGVGATLARGNTAPQNSWRAKALFDWMLAAIVKAPLPPPPPPPAPGVALPELPRARLVVPPLPSSCTVTLGARGNLQAAVKSAVAGDVICLTPGATYGAVTLRARGDTGLVVIRTKSTAGQPGDGVRMRDADSLTLATIYDGVEATGAVTLPSRANGWEFALLRLQMRPGHAVQDAMLNQGDRTQASVADLPTRLILDRVLFTDHPNSLKRVLALNGGSAIVVNSWLCGGHNADNTDSQSIWGAYGSGPYLIENNYLCGASENIMFGGGDPLIEGLRPTDITVRRNYVHKPSRWFGLYKVKNLIELKNAERVLIEGNVFEGSWVGGQDGLCFAAKSANQSNTAPWSATLDVTFRDNICRNVTKFADLAGRGNTNPTTTLASRILIENVLVEDSVNVGIYSAGSSGSARMFLLGDGVRDVTIKRTSIYPTGPCTSWITFTGGAAVTNLSMDGNIGKFCNYGMIGSGNAGAAALRLIKGTTRFTNNVLVGSSKGAAYPATTTFVTSKAAAEAIAGRGVDRKRLAAAIAGVVP